MSSRMANPAMIIPEAMEPIQQLHAAAGTDGVPRTTLELVHLRASQINGCSFCVDSGTKGAKKVGEGDERLFAVAAWRDAPYFTDVERLALELAEAVTRLADRPDPVPDELWERVREHYDEKGIASLLLTIAVTNVFNRLNVPTHQPAGAGAEPSCPAGSSAEEGWRWRDHRTRRGPASQHRRAAGATLMWWRWRSRQRRWC
jgi:AhpD family alkylhydroperoxidase